MIEAPKARAEVLVGIKRKIEMLIKEAVKQHEVGTCVRVPPSMVGEVGGWLEHQGYRAEYRHERLHIYWGDE